MHHVTFLFHTPISDWLVIQHHEVVDVEHVDVNIKCNTPLLSALELHSSEINGDETYSTRLSASKSLERVLIHLYIYR